jgi:hypothetical protein
MARVVVAVAGVGVAWAVGAVAHRRCVLAEMVEWHGTGEQVAFFAGVAQNGEFGLMTLPGMRAPRPVLVMDIAIADPSGLYEEPFAWYRSAGNDLSVSEDVGTLHIKFALDGSRSRTFRESGQEMAVVESDDFPLVLRTTQAYVKEVCRMAEFCQSQHLGWVQRSRIPDGVRAIVEDEPLSHASRCNPGAPNYEGADHLMKMVPKPGGHCGFFAHSACQREE